MSKTTERLQRQIADWFQNLSRQEQQDLEARYKQHAANIRHKDLDLSIDGISGSSTTFLSQEMLKKANSSKAMSKVTDMELAKYLQAETGVAMHCQSCIRANSGRQEEFIKAALKNPNSGYLLELKAILKIPDSEINKVAAKLGSNAQENANKADAFCGAACELQSAIQPEQQSAEPSLKGFIAAEALAKTQGSSTGGVVGQVMATLPLANNNGFKAEVVAGLSQRQSEQSKPFITAANLTIQKSLQSGTVLGLELGIPRVHLDQTNAITKGGKNLACPCSGNAEGDNLPSTINLRRRIYESNPLGAAITVKGDDYEVRAGGGRNMQTDAHKSGDAVAFAEVTKDVGSKTKLLASTSISSGQKMFAAGTQHQVTPKLKVSPAIMVGRGAEEFESASVVATYSPTKNWTISANAVINHDRRTKKVEPELGAELGRRIGKSGFIGAFVATDIPQDRRDKDKVGVLGGLRVGWSF